MILTFVGVVLIGLRLLLRLIALEAAGGVLTATRATDMGGYVLKSDAARELVTA